MVMIQAALLVFLTAPVLAVREGPREHLTLTYETRKSRGEQFAQPSTKPKWPWEGANRAILTARETEDVSWLFQYFSEIPVAVYQSQNPGDPRYFNGQKGREAQAWLSFIIENYHHLPESTAFIHAHRCSWHHGDYVPRIKHLRFGHLDFAPLGIPPTPDPPEGRGLTPHTGGLRWAINQDAKAGKTVEQFVAEDRDPETGKPRLLLDIRDVLAIIWPDLFGDALGSVPAEIEHPMGASIMVSKAAIRRHPQAFYKYMAKWLLDTPLDGYYTARIFEYTWHIIFGEPALMIYHAPCDIYMCDKDGRLPFLTIEDCPINMTTYRPIPHED